MPFNNFKSEAYLLKDVFELLYTKEGETLIIKTAIGWPVSVFKHTYILSPQNIFYKVTLFGITVLKKQLVIDENLRILLKKRISLLYNNGNVYFTIAFQNIKSSIDIKSNNILSGMNLVTFIELITNYCKEHNNFEDTIVRNVKINDIETIDLKDSYEKLVDVLYKYYFI